MPTPKQKEEAREIVQAVSDHTWRDGDGFLRATSDFDKIVDRIASALSARDAEIREVLEGLRMRAPACWCDPYPVKEHGKPCLADRTLYDKLNSTTDTPDQQNQIVTPRQLDAPNGIENK